MDLTGFRSRQEERPKAFAEFVEQAPHPIIETDTAGVIFFRNTAARDLLPSWRDGEPLPALLDDWPKFAEALRREPGKIISRRVTAPPRIFEAHFHMLPGRNRIHGWFSDITASVKAEATNQRFREMADNIEEFLTFVTPAHVYEAANDAYCQAHHLKPESILGRHVSQIWGEKVYNTVIKAHLDRCFSGETVRYQIWIEFPDRGKRYFDVSYYPLRSGDAITHAVVLSRDITNVIEMEGRLEEAETREALAQMARGIVAELETSLHDISPREVPNLSVATRRITAITETLKTYYEPRKRTAEKTDVARLILEEAGRVFPETDPWAKVVREFKPVAPAAMDRATLSRILGILLSNARTSFARPSAANQVSIELWQDEGWIHVAITDTGRGIPEAQLPRIFAPFAGSVIDRPCVGLDVCRNLITTSGGSIELRSVGGRGAQVHLRIPTSFPGEPVAREGSRQRETIRPERGYKAYFAVADRDPSIGERIRSALEKEGEVLLFATGEELMAHLERAPRIDLIFYDAMMHDRSVDVFLKTCRKNWPGIEDKIVFLTSAILPPTVENTLTGLPNRRCTKPIIPAALKRLADELLE